MGRKCQNHLILSGMIAALEITAGQHSMIVKIDTSSAIF